MSRSQGNRLVVACHRRFIMTESRKRVAEINAGVDVVWPDCKCLFVLRNCFFHSTERQQRVAEIVVSLGISGCDRQRLLIVLNCIVIAADCLQSMAEIIVRLGEVRPDREGGLVPADGLLREFETHQSNAKMVVRLGRLAIDVDRPAERARRFVESALLEVKEAQMIKRWKMAIVRFQRALVELFRFPCPLLGVQRPRIVKRLRSTGRLSIHTRELLPRHRALSLYDSDSSRRRLATLGGVMVLPPGRTATACLHSCAGGRPNLRPRRYTEAK